MATGSQDSGIQGPASASEGLSARQQERIEHVVSLCRSENGLDVSVLVGDLNLEALADGSAFRSGAEQLHAALGERAPSAVLVVVAPGQRRLEIVTGPVVRRRVPDRVAALAVLSMTGAFSGGDLAGGIIDGLRQMAAAAGRGLAIAAPPEMAPSTAVARH